MVCILCKVCEDIYVLKLPKEDDLNVTVQPGVTHEDLNEALSGQNIPLFFPVEYVARRTFISLFLRTLIVQVLYVHIAEKPSEILTDVQGATIG